MPMFLSRRSSSGRRTSRSASSRAPSSQHSSRPAALITDSTSSTSTSTSTSPVNRASGDGNFGFNHGGRRHSEEEQSWVVPASNGPHDPREVMMWYESSKSASNRPREASWCSTADPSEPIDIPSPQELSDFEECQAAFAGSPGEEDGRGRDLGGRKIGRCWSAAWYTSEPWNRTTEYPEEVAPEHILIWEERALRSQSLAALAEEHERNRQIRDACISDELSLDADISSAISGPADDRIFEMEI